MATTLRISLLRISALSLLLACSACNKPAPPKKDAPPKPRAEQSTELRDAIQAPIDRAKAVEPAVLDAAEKQRADIDAQTGG